MKISVCVVTYNQHDVVERCLDSIFKQKVLFEDFEIEVIVVDDASTDGTQEILRAYQNSKMKNLSIIFNKTNIGPFENYKYAHSLATGDFVCHCDGDDYWLPNKLQKQVEFLCQQEKCVAVYTNAILVGSENVVLGKFNNAVNEVFGIDYLIEKGNFLHHSSMMYRKDFFKIINEIEGDFIDYEIHIRLANLGLLGYINHCFTAYTVNYSESILRKQSKKISDLYFKSFLAVDCKIVNKFFISKVIARELAVNLYLNKMKNLNFRVDQIKNKFGLVIFFIVCLMLPISIILKMKSKLFKEKIRGSDEFILYPR